MQKFCSVTLFIFLTLPNLSFSQKNAIFGEIGGNAIFYSLNYERKISKEDNKDIYLKIGLSLLGNKTANFTYTGVDKSVNIPLMLNFVKNKKNSIEMGAGILFSYQGGLENKLHIYPTASVKYRHQFMNGAFFNSGWTPTLIDTEGLGLAFLFVPSIGVGCKF